MITFFPPKIMKIMTKMMK